MASRKPPHIKPLRRDLGTGIVLSLVQAPDHGNLELAVVVGNRVFPVATGPDARRLFDTLTTEEADLLLRSHS